MRFRLGIAAAAVMLSLGGLVPPAAAVGDLVETIQHCTAANPNSHCIDDNPDMTGQQKDANPHLLQVGETCELLESGSGYHASVCLFTHSWGNAALLSAYVDARVQVCQPNYPCSVTKANIIRIELWEYIQGTEYLSKVSTPGVITVDDNPEERTSGDHFIGSADWDIMRAYVNMRVLWPSGVWSPNIVFTSDLECHPGGFPC